MSETDTLNESAAYRWRLPITLVSLLAGWTGSLFSPVLVPENSEADRWLDAVGWLVLAAGIGLRAWASREISGRKRLKVVDSGPYALCRNPLYLGTLLIAASQLFFLRTAIYLASLLVPTALYVLGVVPAEEQILRDTLGADYEAYCRQTPRWFPHWNRKALRSSGVEDAASYEREALTLICWALLPFVSEMACYLRELPNWPHWPLPF